jgi:hypothetical protein
MTKQIFVSDLEQQYVKEKYIIFADINELDINTSGSVIKYAKRTLRNELGDEVEVDQVKVKLPGVRSRSFSRLRHRSPQAKLYVTTKF